MRQKMQYFGLVGDHIQGNKWEFLFTYFESVFTFNIDSYDQDAIIRGLLKQLKVGKKPKQVS